MANLPLTLIKQKFFYDNKKLRIELNKLKVKRGELDDKIGESLDNLESENKDYPKKCVDLENEINLLGAKLRNYSRDNPNERMDNIPPPRLSSPPKEVIDPEKEKKCKEIYKEISKKTHPDVAKDEELIPLFSEAKEAMEQGNLLELQRIKEQIDSGNISVKEKFDNANVDELQHEYHLLVREIQREQSEYNKVIESVQFRIYNLCESEDDIDNMVGNKIFLDVVLSKIMQLKGQRDNLKKQMIEKGIE
jgi:hypothetical protein